jgi:acyl-CoA thioester hydrolase
MAQAVVAFKSEAFQEECLTIQAGVGDFNRFGCDFFHRVRHRESGREAARTKTGIVFFDSASRRLVTEPFLARFIQQ